MFTYIQLNLHHDVDRSRILERRNVSCTYTQGRAVSSGKVSEFFLWLLLQLFEGGAQMLIRFVHLNDACLKCMH